MILPDFIIKSDKGLYCKYGDFYLDPQLPVSNAVVSHSHGDHAVAGHRTVLCTSATAAIMQLRLKKTCAKEFIVHGFGEGFNMDEVRLHFFSAGHILGSAMVLMEYRDVKYLYTGDFKLQEDETCEPPEMVTADVLITETTFANPAVVHPDPRQEIEKLNQSNHNVLLGAYSLGKAQRLVNLINRYCPQRKVLLHHSMLAITKLYEDFSYPPGKYEPYNRKLMKFPDQGFVYIVPPLTFESYFRAKGVLRAFASGWKRLQSRNDMELYISDHADWNDILKAVETIKPKEIWTLHGDGTFLQEYFLGTLPVKILN
ncbi:exonuclease [Pedobacter sp. SYSU D00535]|uniref:exonuclease n=1 Tax=Pedobacter sp. SYSU D00535 TaxID=2810308 RepID=UPI001A96C48A|nr:exonuclease [Pedobacter sp. SYSU D00535]